MLKNASLIYLLKTSNMLQVTEELFLNCMKLLTNKKNTCCVFEISKKFSLKELRRHLIYFLQEHFTTFSRTNEFNLLGDIEFKSLISSSQLNISNEIQVFEAIVSWVEYDEQNRKNLMYDLLKMVRINLLSSDIVKNVIKDNKYCRFCENCCIHIENSLLNQPRRHRKMSKKSQNRFFMKKSTSFMFFNKDDEHSGEERNVSLNLFDRNCNDLQFNNLEFASFAFLNKSREQIHLFSSKTKNWTRVAPTLERDSLRGFASCLFMGDLYVTGGEYVRHVSISDSLFKFDTKTNEWKKLKKMRAWRTDHSCVVFDGKIVVTGGNYNIEDSVEAYDHFNDEWSLMPQLTEERFNHGSVAMGNKLYVICGHKMKNCEVFDLVSNKFIRIKPIPLNLSYFDFVDCEVFQAQDKIVVKYNGNEVETNFYIYNKTDDEWTTMSVELFKEKTGHLLYY